MNETPDTAQRPAQPVVATGPLLGSEIWACAEYSDSESWHGPYGSREEAIANLFDYYGAQDGGYISRARPVQPGDDLADESWTFICIGEPEHIEPNVKDQQRRTKDSE